MTMEWEVVPGWLLEHGIPIGIIIVLGVVLYFILRHIIPTMVKKTVERSMKGKPATPFRVPSGIKFIRVNHKTGLPAKAIDKDVILEAFKPDDSFGNSKNIDSDEDVNVIDNDVEDDAPDVGGIY